MWSLRHLVPLFLFAALAAGVQTQVQRLHQLRIKGCPLLVRAHQSKDGFRLNVDPLMCVIRPGSLTGAAVRSRYDPVAKQFFVSVPVTLQDDAVLGSAALKLRHESPVSVTFATITAVSAATDPGSVYSALGFVWSQGEPVGYLRLGCNASAAGECKIESLVSHLSAGNFAALSRVLLSATIRAPEDAASRSVTLDYRISLATPESAAASAGASVQQVLLDYSVSSRREGLAPCAAGRFLPMRSVRVGNCSAMVYADRSKGVAKGRYLVEAPICATETPRVSNESDYSTGKHSLTIRVESPTDKVAQGEVAKQLDDLKPTSVVFMQLWAAQRAVSRLLTGRYDIGQLMVADSESTPASKLGQISGAMRVHCNHVTSCRYLSTQISAHPVDFWRHVTWQPVFKLDTPDNNHCAHSPSDSGRFSVLMVDSETDSSAAGRPPRAFEAAAWQEVCSRGAPCKYVTLDSDGRQFVVVQQRSLGSVDFDRPWSDYVAGFGDDSDFWIGLTALHLLSSHGTTLRLEMRQWNGSELVAEYSGFSVGDASTNYRMTYREMVSAMSNVNFDAMDTHRGMGFSTKDRDNDNDVGSCSLVWGRGGWWFNACYKFYPNGMFMGTFLKDWKYINWASNTEVVPLRWVRMMLLI